MSWHPPDPDRITLARLDGTTTRHVATHGPDDIAIAELRELATQVREQHGRPILRVDLLSEAAGAMLGKHQADPVVGWIGERGAQLLFAAGGTDQDIGRAAADLARERLGGGRSLSGCSGLRGVGRLADRTIGLDVRGVLDGRGLQIRGFLIERRVLRLGVAVRLL